MLPLIHGNPEQAPASFSRFVLPFAYRLLPDDGGAVAYEPEEPSDDWRRRYLTHETGRVLFDRARWFHLSGLGPEVRKGVFNLQGNCRIRAEMAAPRLVLFEYPESGHAGELDELRTGFLILELFFPKEESTGSGAPQLDDLLLVNELFRYWWKPYPEHDHDATDPGGKSYAKFLKDWPLGLFGATLGGETRGVQYRGRWQGFLTLPVRHSERQYRKLILSAPSEERGDWSIHADDRTYVWTCALIENGGAALRDTLPPKPGLQADDLSSPPLAASNYGHWIKLLNVDSPGKTPESTHETRRFERDWAEPLTYHRWEEYGTFYGFTPHSGAMLGKVLERDDPPLWKHFGRMYFDQILLLLYVRTTLFRFSEEITRISAKARDAGRAGDDKWRETFENLRRDFALFTNLYQFPSLSNQQQAVELYGLARKAMDIDELFREIQSEIHASHDYLVMINEQRQAEIGNRQAEMSTLLTVVATLGLVLGLAASLLGMNVLVTDSVNAFGKAGDMNVLITDWVKALGEGGEGKLFVVTVIVCGMLVGLGIIFSKCLARTMHWLSGLPGRFCERFSTCQSKTP
jgi:hypothetical protein